MVLGIAFVHWLVIISACISIAGASAYIRDTLRGTTKPNRVSYALWAFAPLLGGVAAISAGADFWATVRVFISGLIPLIVFFVSFVNPQSYWKLTFFDYFCGAFAIVALGFWGLANSPVMAILFLAIADGFAALPTVIKAWKHPETETKITYVAGLVAVLLILPSIPVWNIENSAFQIYLLIANVTLIFAVYRKQLGFK
jgi:hypothetical protein